MVLELAVIVLLSTLKVDAWSLSPSRIKPWHNLQWRCLYIEGQTYCIGSKVVVLLAHRQGPLSDRKIIGCLRLIITAIHNKFVPTVPRHRPMGTFLHRLAVGLPLNKTFDAWPYGNMHCKHLFHKKQNVPSPCRSRNLCLAGSWMSTRID